MRINMHGPIVIADGYGSAACHIALWMERLGMDVRAINMYPSNTNPYTLPPEIVKISRKEYVDGDVMYYVNPAFAKFHPRYEGQPIVVMSMLETTKIPEVWVQRYNEVDLVHNPSTWGVNMFKLSGVLTPIEVMPLGVEPDKVKYINREFSKPFVFTFIAVEMNDERKNAKMLMQAFDEEFGDNPDVELWLKTKTNFKLPVLENDNLVIIEGEATKEEMQEIIENTHCFVFPTKSEGFGLPPLEAMATGCPTIATYYSSMTDFLKDEYCYPLKIETIEKIDQTSVNEAGLTNYPIPIFGEDIGSWSVPSKERLKYLMRHVYENYDEALHKGHKAYLEVEENWTYDKSVAKIIKSLERM
jgi:glycosyltransferase involved in cell wall biosynthesis